MDAIKKKRFAAIEHKRNYKIERFKKYLYLARAGAIFALVIYIFLCDAEMSYCQLKYDILENKIDASNKNILDIVYAVFMFIIILDIIMHTYTFFKYKY